MDLFRGVPLIVTPDALEVTEERLFPVSRHRSKRIHKKLVKRFGGEFRRVPCIWQSPHSIYIHPSMYAELKRELERRDAVATIL